MIVKSIVNYQTSENCYLVYDTEIRKAIAVDPGSAADKIIVAAHEENVDISCIMLTHCHYDHIAGLEELRKITGAPLAAGKMCSVNIGDPDINLTFYGLNREISAEKAEIIMSDGEERILAGMNVKCIYTPGHTNCSVCFLVNDVLFSGDTLFLRNVGRWDLPTGNGDMLKRSIREKLYSLHEETKVYPGHGDPTSIGYEKKFNLFIPE